jgi:ketosteroid isomerase-like protein
MRLLPPVLIAAIALAVTGCDRGAPAGSTTEGTAALSGPTASETAAAITALEQQWVEAILKKDAATIERLLVPEFIGTTNDVRYTRDEAIEDVTTGAHEALGIEGLDIHVFGDTAVATFEQEERSHHGAEDFSGRYLFTNVWARQGDTWRVVASHGARIR